MIKNHLSEHDLKKALWNIKQIKETFKITNEECCNKDYVKWSINCNIDDAIYYLNALKEDIER